MCVCVHVSIVKKKLMMTFCWACVHPLFHSCYQIVLSDVNVKALIRERNVKDTTAAREPGTPFIPRIVHKYKPRQ